MNCFYRQLYLLVIGTWLPILILLIFIIIMLWIESFLTECLLRSKVVTTAKAGKLRKWEWEVSTVIILTRARFDWKHPKQLFLLAT